MELNPIFRLELLQCRRNYILPAMFLGGCILTGISFFLPGLIQNWLVSPGLYWLIPLVNIGFALIPILVVVWASLKFAAQQVNEDLVLYTPLSPHRIFMGKILLVLVLILCLRLPGILATIWNLAYRNHNDYPAYYPLVATICGLLRTVCWATIGLGFMAGARSMVMRAVMVAWALLFMGGLYVSCGMITRTISMYMMDALRPAGLPHREIYVVLSTCEAVYAAICLIAATAIYFMGIQLLRGSRNLKAVMLGTLGFGIVSSATLIALLMYRLSMNRINTWDLTFGIVGCVFWMGFVFIPVLAMYTVSLYDRRYKVVRADLRSAAKIESGENRCVKY